MCSPTAAVMAVGTGVSAYGQYQAGQFNSKMAERQAQIQEEAAQDAINRGEDQADQVRENTESLIGDQRAAAGASGVEVSSGSPQRLQADSAYSGELDALRVKENARREALGMRRQAQSTRLQGEMTEQSSKLSAGSSLLTGGAGIARNEQRLGRLRKGA